GLEHARPRHAQVDVLGVGGPDQLVKHGIAEEGPPGAVVCGDAFDPGIARIDPCRGQWGRRTLVVGPDLEAVLDEPRKRRAAARQECQAEEPPQEQRIDSPRPAASAAAHRPEVTGGGWRRVRCRTHRVPLRSTSYLYRKEG